MHLLTHKQWYTFAACTAFVLVGVLIGHVSFAQMNSGSYKIQSDSVNFGGAYSTSTSYYEEDTLGEIATGESESANYKIAAGYQQMQRIYLAITAVADVVMSPNIAGVTGGTSNGSTVVTVTTDNPAGYDLYIKASSSPALVSDSNPSNTFADYTPAGSDPDFTFSILTSASEFAFSPEGTHIVQKYKDNGSACNAGSNNSADTCWDALSTSNKLISENLTPNHPSGTATTLKFRAQSGGAHIQPPGEYTATTTVTALPL